MPTADMPVHYQRYRVSAGWDGVDDRVIAETAVTLSVNGQPWLNFTCTPTHQDDLAVGFLYNEGILQHWGEIAAVDVCAQGDHVDVWLNRAAERPAFWQRTSGCSGGVTSVTEDLPANPHPNPRGAVLGPEAGLTPRAILTGMEQLLESQSLYRQAGGVHSSALSDGQSIRAHAEDIGRHNTLDKLAGQVLRLGLVLQPAILLTTGRVSSEMMQKAARLRAAAVVSRTSPTSQSVTLAEAWGITLVGYARRTGFQVYTHPERIHP
jgi:FdhD protein